MEFEINVKTGLNGDINIEDYSLTLDEYTKEDSDTYESGKYKYSESKTINVIIKSKTNKDTIIQEIIHEHNQKVSDPLNSSKYEYELEQINFQVKNDGYYKIQHIVLPKKEYYQHYIKLNKYDNFYVIDNDNSLYKYDGNNFIECDINDIINDNYIFSNIEKCIIEIFYVGFLHFCYINYCKKLFNNLIKNCKCIQKNYEDIIYYRDFLLMTLNIIEYYISFKQYIEAQRILELVNNCCEFCKNLKDYESDRGCGCS